MSTNKTANYKLHKWEAGDDFLRTEFNENFAKLDAGAVQVIFGSYQGQQDRGVGTTQRIELGVKPKVVIITSAAGFEPNSAELAYGGVGTAVCNMSGNLVLDETGFTVKNTSYTLLNRRDRTYYYVILL